MSLQQEVEQREEAAQLPNRNWTWSIRPIVVWTEVLCVGFLNENRAKTCHLRFYLVLISLSINIASQIMCLNHVFRNIHKLSHSYVKEIETKTNALAWNTAIDFVNFSVHSVGTHIALIFVVLPRWKTLMKTCENLEYLFNLNYLVKIRKFSILCLLYVIIVSFGLDIMVAYHHKTQESELEVTIIGILSTSSEIYPKTAIALFAAVTYAPINAYQLLRSDLNLWKDLTTTQRQRYAKLLTLKKYHIHICEVIDSINDCFGWVLAVCVSFSFISFVTSTFYLFGHLESSSSMVAKIFFLFHIIHLFVICFTADSLDDQSKSLSRELVGMQVDMEEPFKSLISAFIKQVDQLTPQVTALDFYFISKRILPKIVATTLTYFIILYEFQSSEDI